MKLNYDLVASRVMNSRYDIENGNRLATTSTVDISSWSDGLYMITVLMALDQQTRYGISVYVFNKFFDDIRLLTPIKEVTKATITGISVTDGVATITYSDNGYHMTSIVRL